MEVTRQKCNPAVQEPDCRFFDTGDRKIAYRRREGKGPCVVFLSGFKSDMGGTKARWLDEYCAQAGQAYLRFDYTGHGLSSGSFEKGTIGSWIQDALDVVDHLTKGPLVLVGSSMGGWIMLHVALQRQERMHALLGLASAPDFTEKLIWEQFTDEQRQQMQNQGVVHLPSCYGEEPYAITSRLIEDGRGHQLLDAPIAVTCPVRLVHGLMDEDVPPEISLRLMQRLESWDVRLQLIKSGGHRLSEPSELETIGKVLEELL